MARVIFIWMTLWLGAVITNHMMVHFGPSFFGNPYGVSLYFFASAIFGIAFYKISNALEHHVSLRKQLLLILIFTFFIFTTSFITNIYFPLRPDQLQAVGPYDLRFQLFRFDTWIAKLADICFQQVYIFALLRELMRLNLAKKKAIQLFGLTFAALHLPLVIPLQWRAFYFIIPSIFAGFIFSYLILNFKRGVFYSFALHLCFYFLLGLFLRNMG